MNISTNISIPNGINITNEPVLLTLFVLYIVVILVLGIVANRKNKGKSLEDHYVASGSLGTIVLLMTTLASSFSGYTVVGIPGEAYRDGFRVMRWFPGAMGLVVMWILYSPRMYNLSHHFKWVSPIDPIKWRFQNNKYLSFIVSLYIMFPQIIYIWGQFSAIGTTTEGLTGGSIRGLYGALLLAGIMLIYEILGGMRGVAYTDVAQGFIMLVGFISVVIFQGIQSGGMFTAIRILNEKHPEKTTVPNLFDRFEFLGFQFSIMLANPHYGHIIQRVFSAQSRNTIRRSVSLLLFVPLVCTLPPMTMGWIQLAKDPLYPGNQKSDQTFSVIISEFLQNGNPWAYGIASLLLSASIAAMMSTIDSVLLSFVSVITLDFIKPFKDFSYKVFNWIGIGISIVVTIGSALLTNYVQIDLSNVLLFQNNVTIQLFPCYFCALFIDSMHWQGLFVGLLAGSIFQIVTFFGVRIPVPGIIGLIINILIVIFTQLFFVHFLKKISITEKYPDDLLPLDEPYRHHKICMVALFCLVMLTPWYWPLGYQTPDFLGLPIWSLLVLVLCTLLAIGGVLIIMFYWKDKEYHIINDVSLLLNNIKI